MRPLGPDRRTLIASLLVSVAVAETARAAQRLPDFPGPSANEQISVTDAGMSLATYPMTDVSEQTKYFGANLTERGVLPVWLSISNGTPDQTFIVDASEIAVESGDPKGGQRDKAASASGTGNDQAVANTAAWLGIYGLPLIAFADAGLIQANEVRRSLIENAFYSHTIHPGQNASGFIFLKAPGARVTLSGTTLAVTLHPIGAGSAARTYHLNLVAPQPA